MTAITITSDAQWRELRQRHVNGSEVGALVGESPHTTPFELYLRKRCLLPEPDLSDNERVQMGLIVQDAIMEAVRQRTGWTVRKMRRYYTSLPALAFGGTPDCEIIGHDRGPGIGELKNVDGLVYHRWGGVLPLYFELQLQSYLELTGRSWGVLALLIGGNRLELIEYERRPRTAEIIKQRVAEFWLRIAEDRPPPIDYVRDADAISELYRSVEPGKVIDMSSNNRLPELCAEYQRAAAAKGVEDKARKAAQAEIMTLIGEAETVICGDITIRAAEVRGVPDRIVDASMIGTVIRGRSGYRGLHVSKRKERTAA